MYEVYIVKMNNKLYLTFTWNNNGEEFTYSNSQYQYELFLLDVDLLKYDIFVPYYDGCHLLDIVSAKGKDLFSGYSNWRVYVSARQLQNSYVEIIEKIHECVDITDIFGFKSNKIEYMY